MSEPDPIDDLMAIAEAPNSSKAEFRQHLEWLLTPRRDGISIAASHFRAGGQQRTKAEHNSYLDAVRAKAEGLSAALRQLREYPYGHSLFWLQPAFRPIDGSREQAILESLDTLLAAADAARSTKAGAPVHRGSRNLVSLAAGMFEEFTKRSASATEGSAFLAFAERFHELATGEPLRGSLKRQATVVLAERKSRKSA